MASLQDPGEFDLCITNRITFKTIPPKSDDTGDFEMWLWNREYWEDLVKTEGGHMTLWGRCWG